MSEKFDKMAWEAIFRRRRPPAGSNKGLARSGRSADYQELEVAAKELGLQHAFLEFLDEFYDYRTADFFEKEPSQFFSPTYRAFLAGVAEFFCHQFSLTVPEWTEKPEYFLPEEYDRKADLLRDLIGDTERDDSYLPDLRAKTAEEFRRRNILYEARGLIRL
jgi:hypothetical protein